jgi:hypothetical protein
MLTLNEILAALRAGKNVTADISALRERFEIELDDLTRGMKIEYLIEEGEDDLVAEAEQLNKIIALLGDAEEALARGDQTALLFLLIKVSTVR